MSPDHSPATQPAHTNRLIHATSPYLLQHAHNPVEWYEWGPAAIERAKRENKPIFLSIGYAACHWCHVMAHECFEDEAIARLMNDLFINIKVDREERPDIDEIYMQATMMLNRGAGGWPMSVWLTPDLHPFFAGTYFPPEDRYGRPGFPMICRRIDELWQERRDELESQGAQLAEAVRQSLLPSSEDGATITLDLIDKVVNAVANAFDDQRGGLLSGGTNKFPPSMTLDLFLRSAARRESDAEAERLRELVVLTLDQMAYGGIYDQLAGGICRYSTDVAWHVPHFEKMLYDQALVSRICIDAFQVTGKPLYRRMATEIFDYVLDDLRAPGGAFFSSRDADSEGEEGKYYVWTRHEAAAVLGDDADLVCDYFDIRAAGNWEDPHAPGVPKNVLRITTDLDNVAKRHGVAPDVAKERIAVGRAKLLAARSKRVAPGLDDKVLCEWNGLMIASLARGGAALGEPKYVDAAVRAADFVLEHQCVDGRLRRAYRDGHTLEKAFLTDYACLIEALLELYEATFDRRWFDHAAKLNQTAIALFADHDGGGFFLTPADGEQLIARSKDLRDSATPSGNSVQLMNLLRLGAMTGDASLRKLADETIATFAGEVLKRAGMVDRFLTAIEFALVGPTELAFIGPLDTAAMRALVATARERYLPNRIMMQLDPDHADASPDSPLLAGRAMLNGEPTAYVCRDYACKQPVTTPNALAAQLAETR